MKLTLEVFEEELDLAMELKNRYYLSDYESIKLACELKKTRHIGSISDDISPVFNYSFASRLFDILESK